MQYADVALAVRSGRHRSVYTYSLPPNLLAGIQPGVLVAVPVGQRIVHGVITQLRAQLPDQRLRGRLRPIHRLLSPWPIFTPQELTFRRQIAADSLAPEHLFLTLGLPAASTVKTISSPIPFRPLPASGSVCLLEGPGNNRRRVIQLLRTCLDKGQPALLLTPTVELTKLWQTELLSAGESRVAILAGSQRVTDELPVWQTVLLGEPRVIIGTRAAIWLPFRLLGLTIVDQADHHQFIEEQAPYYHASQIARTRHALTGGQLFLRDSLPPLDILAHQRRQWRFIPPPALPSIEILQQKGNWLSQRTETRIETALANHQRALIVLHQHGWATGLVCRNCQRLVRCPGCDSLLTVTGPGSAPVCRLCHQERTVDRCLACGSRDITAFGWGTEHWSAALAERYPKARLAELNRPSGKSWDLGLLRPNWLEIPAISAELVIAVQPERLLFGHTFDADERWLRFLLQLRSSAQKNLIIETRLIDRTPLEELSVPLPKGSLRLELLRRRSHHYPPYARLLTVTGPERRIDRLIALADQLRRLTGEAISGPAPADAGQLQLRAKLPRNADITPIGRLLEKSDGQLISQLFD